MSENEFRLVLGLHSLVSGIPSFVPLFLTGNELRGQLPSSMGHIRHTTLYSKAPLSFVCAFKSRTLKLIYRKRSHKNDENFSQNSCSPWAGRSLGSNDASQLVKSVSLPNTAVWKQHYHSFPRGLNFQQNKLNHNIAEFNWGEGLRREGPLKQKQQNVLASRGAGTPKK